MPVTRRKKWILRASDENIAETLTARLNIPSEIAILLVQRGIKDHETCQKFLNPSLIDLPSPYLLKNMQKGVDLFVEGLHNNAQFIIYGDYDADGITGTAVLLTFLQELGIQPTYCLPHRIHDGYGVHIHLLEKLLNGRQTTQDRILITVDCGITDHEAVHYAQKNGCKVIITDHHQPTADIPAADAVINPCLPGCAYPFKGLAGVGVAFHLIMGVRGRLIQENFWPHEKIPNLKSYLDMVAIGTIADMMPLVGPNRIMAKAGLEILRSEARLGIKKLCETNNISPQQITFEDIAYKIAPCFNAAGRIDHPENALNLLINSDRNVIADLSIKIIGLNKKRKTACEELFEKAYEMALEEIKKGKNHLLIVGNNWHIGLLGIVATRLTKEFYRPALVLSRTESIYKGSGRSIPGIELYRCLEACQDQLISYGGHQNAVGLSLKTDNLESFAQQFDMAVNEYFSIDLLTEQLQIDLNFNAREFDGNMLLQYYQRLEPFGNGNPEPVYIFNTSNLQHPTIVGRNHLKFSLSQNNFSIKGIGFNFGHHIDSIKQKMKGRAAISFRRNTYNGKQSWQAVIEDLQFDNTQQADLI